MWFELVHRASSGLLILLVAGLLVTVLRTFPAAHAARKSAVAAAVVMVVEALLGAGLVLFGLVAENDSAARAVVIAVHLTNTLILLALLALTAWFSSRPKMQADHAGALGLALGVGLVSVAVVGATGAVTALGDTLFPSASLGEGIRRDLGPTAHFLIRMRMVHPILAVATGGFLIMLAAAIGRGRPRASRAAMYVTVCVIGQIAIGFVNLALMAPIPMQVAHLLAADLLWIALIIMSAETWCRPVESLEHPPGVPGLDSRPAQPTLALSDSRRSAPSLPVGAVGDRP